MTYQIASASGNPTELRLKYVGGRGEPGQDGENGTGLNNIRLSKIMEPILSIFKSNNIADTVAPNNSDADVPCIRSTAKTYIDMYGVLRTAQINEIAIEKDGALIEMASENKAIYSEEYNNAAWTKNGTTVNGNATTAPDLTNNADEIIFTNNSTIDQGVAISSSSQSISFSAFVKDNGLGEITLRWITTGGTTQDYFNVFDFDNGSFSSIDVNCSANAERLNNGWFRLCVTANENGTGNTAFRPRFFSADAGSIYAFGTQVEEQAACTSYIKSTSTTGQRAADNVEIQIYNNVVFNSAWTFCTKIKVTERVGNSAVWGSDPIPAANNPRLLVSPTGQLVLVDSTGSAIQITEAGAIPNDQPVKIAIRSNAAGNIDALVDGEAQLAPQASTLNNLYAGNLKIGETNFAAEQIKINIDNFTWYDDYLTDEEINYL